MASVATDRQGSTNAVKPPISTHPLFPAIVALWFAALLGLGSLVLPTALLERAAMATGISAVVPAAAPPFGVTARLLIALAFTLAGTAAGLLIARRVARAHAPKPVPRFSQERSEPITRPPINAHEELGHEGFDGQAPGRRRSLAMMEDEGPSEYLDRAPLPDAQEPSWLTSEEKIDAKEPLELLAIAEDAGPGAMFSVKSDAAPAGEGDALTFEERDECEVEAIAARQVFQAPGPGEETLDEEASVSHVFGPESFEPEARERQEFDSVRSEEPDPGRAEALASPPSSRSRGKQLETAQAHYDAGAVPDKSRPQAGPADEEVAETEMTKKPTMDWSQTVPDELGLVQLAERLGSAIERHRDYVAARAAPRATPQRQAPKGFDIAEPDEAALAKDAYFGGAREAPCGVQGSGPVSETRLDTAPKLHAQQQEAGPTSENAQLSEIDGEVERQVFGKQTAPPKAYQAFAGFSPAADSHSLGNDEYEEEEDEVEELAASLSLPIQSKSSRPLFLSPEESDETASPPAPKFQADEERDDVPVEELDKKLSEPSNPSPASVPHGYGSLLGIKNPFKEGGEKFVRVDEEEFATRECNAPFEPAVIFPGHEQPRSGSLADKPEAVKPAPVRAFDPPRQSSAQAQKPTPQRTGSNDTDEMLREALLNLQRTSGAA